MYDLDIKPTLDRIFKKMMKRDNERLKKIFKKVEEIQRNPRHEYKHLRRPLQEFYRVHINSSFVLIFDINHTEELVVLYYFAHHDEVYKWHPKKED